jgi:hypothetical protein
MGGLGVLSSVDVREVWAHEARHFTPWLADNIERLSAVLGMRLEVEGVEVGVAPFWADILALSPEDGARVLIENQLTQTDHRHLGQIMTYLAGLQAQRVVWIATDFSEPHLSAVQWLNEHTAEPFAFFAVRISAVRIGDSPAAPLFEIMAKPNDWDRQVAVAAPAPGPQAVFRTHCWNNLLHHWPEAAIWVRPGGSSSQWFPVEGMDLVVAVWVGREEVGVYVRGARGVEAGEVKQVLASRVGMLQHRLDVALDSGGPGHFFAKSIPADTHDDAAWEGLAGWLREQVTLYTEVLQQSSVAGGQQ